MPKLLFKFIICICVIMPGVYSYAKRPLMGPEDEFKSYREYYQEIRKINNKKQVSGLIEKYKKNISIQKYNIAFDKIVTSNVEMNKYIYSQELLSDGSIKVILNSRKTNNWYSTDLGNNIHFIVSTEINERDNLFQYNYHIIVDKRSKYPILDYIVEIPFGKLENIEFPQPEEMWVKFDLEKQMNGQRLYNGIKVFQWTIKRSYYFNESFRSRLPFVPGNSKTLSYTSYGLPGIVLSFVHGQDSLNIVKGTLLEGDPGFIIPPATNKLNSIGYLEAYVVGPVNLPWIDNTNLIDSKYSSFIARLQEYILLSYKIGWIEETNALQWINNKLIELKNTDSMQKKETIIEEILNYTENNKNKSILSEAYGLIKYNIKYIENNLLKDSSK